MNSPAHSTSSVQVETTIPGSGASGTSGQLVPVVPLVSVVRPLHGSPTAEKPMADPDTSSAPTARTTSSGDTSNLGQFARDIDPARLVVIPAGVSIKGVLETGGSHAVVISGHFEGDINTGAHPVIIKEGATVIGCVQSDDVVVIAGSLASAQKDGEAIVTKGLWVLAESGSVKGNVAYGRQRAYEGGLFSGRARPFAEYAEKS